jgi:hypothetical protein
VATVRALLAKAHAAHRDVGCGTCPGQEASAADVAPSAAPVFLIAAE